MHEKIRDKWVEYHSAETIIEADACAQHLLSLMGSVRYIVGPKSLQGRRLADRMNSLKQERNVAREKDTEAFNENLKIKSIDICAEVELPWL